MALPEKPFSRKEQYLSKIAGQDTEIPEEPFSREEMYLDEIARNGGGGGGTSDFDDLSNRPSYNGVAMTGTTNIPEVQSYSNFVGTDGQTAGSAGLVPAPATTDADKFLKSDGTWATAGGGGPTVVQTTGNSTTDVMSQDATTKMVFYNGNQTAIRLGSHAYPQSNNYNICIGDYSYSGYYGVSVGHSCYTMNSGRAVALGNYAYANQQRSIAIGGGLGTNEKALANHENSIAIGCGASTTVAGQVAVGTMNGIGYNGTAYRLVSGVHDGVSANDAATVGQISQLLNQLNSALGTSLTISNGVITNSSANNNSNDASNTGSGDGEPGPEDMEAPGP